MLNQGAHKDWRFFSIDDLEWDPEMERWIGDWEDGLSTALISCPLAAGVVLFHAFNSGQPLHQAMAPLPLKAASRLHLHVNIANLFQHTTKVKQMRGKNLGLEAEPEEEPDPAT